MRQLLAWICVIGAATASGQEVAPHLEPQTSGTRARLVALSIVNPSVVWAAGAEGTYARTIDGGSTWHSGLVPGGDSLSFTGVYAESADRALLLSAGQGRRARIYRTTDAGVTWSVVFQNEDSSAFFDCMAFRGNIGVALSDPVNGMFPIVRTTDAGRTWTPFVPPGYDVLHALSGEGAAAFGTCVVVQPEGTILFGTTKGGRVFRVGADRSDVVQTPIVHGGATAGILTLAFRDAQTGTAAGGDLSKGDSVTHNVVVTHDGGKTWTVAGHPPIPAVYALSYVPDRPRTLVAVSAKGSAWSADEGTTWHSLDGHDYWGVRFGAGGIGWMVGPNGRVTKITLR
jgi:photosystem II stability/assembly factor-like uncharacterized protein